VSGVESYYGNADARLRSAKGDTTYALIKLRLAADEGMAPSSACARSCAAIAW